jgi:15-cis-phytoene synthase
VTTLQLTPGAVGLAPGEARAIIRRHSKSFSLASVLLGEGLRERASGLYAYCRRADDAVDLVAPQKAPEAVLQLRAELDAVYAGGSLTEPVLVEFQRLVFEANIPREYPEALLDGFHADATHQRYETLSDLYRYCWCVAGSVGAMMCHVLGVRRARAVRHGVHLGMAMQLTNICRDVAEDWERGRLYLPQELVPGLPRPGDSQQLPPGHAAACAQAVRHLLARADLLYASGDLGLPYLSFRSRLAVATARRVYASIGQRLLDGGVDLLGGRTVVPDSEKALHVLGATVACVGMALTTPPFRAATLEQPLRFPEDVLPF